MKTCCIVVIGHVDHGKTALVRRLTGIDTDRLPEEKERGLSIKPGFAHRHYPQGVIDFVDAPGHEDFLQAMVSGASGARAALLVISAVEGIQAQTLEHLTIAGLLGIKRGVVALTKADALTMAEQEARLEEIRQALAATPLAGAAIQLCSAQSGAGIEGLHDALESLLVEPLDGPALLQTMLPIDRVFSMPGRGTIVTGTLLGGELQTHDAVTVLPRGQTTTIRGLQSRGAERDVVHPGERIAANLRGLSVEDISTGDVLCLGEGAAASFCVDVALEVLPEAPVPLKHMDQLRVLFATSSEVAQLRLFGAGHMKPGEKALGQLRFDRPVVGFAGQPAILRRLSPPDTLGGAILLDVQAAPTRAGDKERVAVLKAAQTGNVVEIAKALARSQCGVISLSDVARLSRITGAEAGQSLAEMFREVAACCYATIESIEAAKEALCAALAAYHAKHPLAVGAGRNVTETTGMAAALRQFAEAELICAGLIRRAQSGLALSGHDPIANLSVDQRSRMSDIENRYRASGLIPLAGEPRDDDTVDQALRELLLARGALIKLQNVSLKQTLIVHADAVSAAKTALLKTFPPPARFTTGQARSALATSRRIIVPLLEHLDSCAVTLRSGDTRQMADANPMSPPGEAAKV